MKEAQHEKRLMGCNLSVCQSVAFNRIQWQSRGAGVVGRGKRLFRVREGSEVFYGAGEDIVVAGC